MTDYEVLRAQLDAISTKLDDVRRDYAVEARKRDARIRTNRTLTYVVLAFALVGIVVGIGGVHAWNDARHDTTERLRASCLQVNKSQHEAIAAADLHDSVEAELLVPLPRSPAQQAKVDSGLARLQKANVVGHHLRDCTDRGIAEYLKPVPAPTSTSTTPTT